MAVSSSDCDRIVHSKSGRREEVSGSSAPVSEGRCQVQVALASQTVFHHMSTTPLRRWTLREAVVDSPVHVIRGEDLKIPECRLLQGTGTKMWGQEQW